MDLWDIVGSRGYKLGIVSSKKAPVFLYTANNFTVFPEFQSNEATW